MEHYTLHFLIRCLYASWKMNCTLIFTKPIHQRKPNNKTNHINSGPLFGRDVVAHFVYCWHDQYIVSKWQKYLFGAGKTVLNLLAQCFFPQATIRFPERPPIFLDLGLCGLAILNSRRFDELVPLLTRDLCCRLSRIYGRRWQWHPKKVQISLLQNLETILVTWVWPLSLHILRYESTKKLVVINPLVNKYLFSYISHFK